MTKNDDVPNVESGQGDSGADAGQRQTKETSGDQQTSRSDEKISPQIADLIEQAVARGLQSQKDRGVARNAKQIDALGDQFQRLAELIASGLTPDQARREMVIDQMVGERLGGGESNTADSKATGSREESSNVDYEPIIKAMGLKVDDPEVLQIIADNDPAQAVQEFAKLVLAQSGETGKRVTGTGVSVELKGGGETENPIANITDPAILWQKSKESVK